MRALAPHRRDERGVSLVLVLVALVVFGLLVPILGQFGSTNGVSGYVLKGQRFDRYAAESGMQGAIAWAQGLRTAGRVNVACPEVQTGPLNGSSSAFDRSVTVKCQGFHDSGKTQPTPRMPEFAVMALRSSGTPLDVRGGGRIRTSGAWWSNGGIVAEPPSSVDASEDYVGARASCTSGLQAAALRCNTGQTKPDPDDAGWAVALPVPVPVDPYFPNPCAAVQPNRVVVVDPGLHWDWNFFDDVSAGDCGPAVVWLRPGTHVFDFKFYDPDSRADWRLRSDGIVVVGGAPIGWAPNGGGDQAAQARSAVQSEAGACDPADGAVVGFAADFQLRLRDGFASHLELCGRAGTAQRLAIAQIKHGTDPAEQTSGLTTPTTVTKASPAGSFNFPTSPPNPTAPFVATECVGAPGNCAPGNFASGTVRGDRATGIVTFTIPNPVPADASVRSIQLRLSHREQERRGGDLRLLRVWIAGLPAGAACELTDPGHGIDASGSWRTATADEATCDLTGFRRPFRAGPLQVNVAVDTNRRHREGNQERDAEVTLGIDQVALSATYTPAGYRTATTTGRGLTIAGEATARFDGTVYLPNKDAEVFLGGRPATTFRRGLIVGSIDLEGLPDDPTFAPFSLPGGGSYADRLVTFAAFLVGDTSGVPLLTARVRFCDEQPEDGPPVPGCDGTAGQPPQVLSWQPTK